MVMVEKLLHEVFSFLSSLIILLVIAIVKLLVDGIMPYFGFQFQTFITYIPYAPIIYQIARTLSLVWLSFVGVIFVLKSVGYIVGMKVERAGIWKFVIKFFVFGSLSFFALTFMFTLFKALQPLYASLISGVDFDAVVPAETGWGLSSDIDLGTQITGVFANIVSLLVNCIITIIIFIDIIKLVAKIIEMYLKICLMLLLSPLGFVMGILDETALIFSHFIRVFIADMFVYLLSLALLMCVFALCGTFGIEEVRANSGYGLSSNVNTGVGSLVWSFIIVAFLKLALSLDKFISELGVKLHTSPSGSTSLLWTTMMAIRTVQRMLHSGHKGGNTGGNTGGNSKQDTKKNEPYTLKNENNESDTMSRIAAREKIPGSLKHGSTSSEGMKSKSILKSDVKPEGTSPLKDGKSTDSSGIDKNGINKDTDTKIDSKGGNQPQTILNPAGFNEKGIKPKNAAFSQEQRQSNFNTLSEATAASGVVKNANFGIVSNGARNKFSPIASVGKATANLDGTGQRGNWRFSANKGTAHYSPPENSKENAAMTSDGRVLTNLGTNTNGEHLGRAVVNGQSIQFKDGSQLNLADQSFTDHNGNTTALGNYNDTLNDKFSLSKNSNGYIEGVRLANGINVSNDGRVGMSNGSSVMGGTISFNDGATFSGGVYSDPISKTSFSSDGITGPGGFKVDRMGTGHGQGGVNYYQNSETGGYSISEETPSGISIITSNTGSSIVSGDNSIHMGYDTGRIEFESSTAELGDRSAPSVQRKNAMTQVGQVSFKHSDGNSSILSAMNTKDGIAYNYQAAGGDRVSVANTGTTTVTKPSGDVIQVGDEGYKLSDGGYAANGEVLLNGWSKEQVRIYLDSSEPGITSVKTDFSNGTQTETADLTRNIYRHMDGSITDFNKETCDLKIGDEFLGTYDMKSKSFNRFDSSYSSTQPVSISTHNSTYNKRDDVVAAMDQKGNSILYTNIQEPDPIKRKAYKESGGGSNRRRK